MNEPKDFSFSYLFKYYLRYALVFVLCAALGVAGGVLYAAKKPSTNLEKYTGTLTINAMEYTLLRAPDVSTSGASLTDFALYAHQLSQITDIACDADVASHTFEALRDRLYPFSPNIDDKIKQFNQSLSISRGTDYLVVGFTYDIKDEETDRALARDVINTYLEYAKLNIERAHPIFAEHDLIAFRPVEQDYLLSEKDLASNERPSPFLYAGIGAVVGLVVAAGLLFLAYLLDPRIKTVADILPEDRCAVVNADAENAVIDLVASMKSAEVKKLLLAAPADDEDLEPFADKLCEYLSEGEKKVKKINFLAQDPMCLRYFDGREDEGNDYEIYLCRNVGMGLIGYVGTKADAAAVFADQKKVMGKKLKATVNSVKDCKYLCTVIHNAGRAYLD